MDTNNIFIQPIEADWLSEDNLTLDVLRLDAIHPVVSGNKWFKLKYYLRQATDQQKDTLVTFGGAFSNHIIATAFACNQVGLKSIGIIRGEPSGTPSATLQYAHSLGMHLIFVTREEYKQKEQIISAYNLNHCYVVNEGGYGIKGALGAKEILQLVPENDYTHIIASVGTGTMLAGLIMSARLQQNVIGISSMKGNEMLEQAVKDLLISENNFATFSILHDYHFGGYGKYPPPLIAFMNQAWQQFQLPLDIIYTGKLFFAIVDLVSKKQFKKGSKLLMIHSGGLQGNNSLSKNQLSFS